MAYSVPSSAAVAVVQKGCSGYICAAEQQGYTAAHSMHHSTVYVEWHVYVNVFMLICGMMSAKPNYPFYGFAGSVQPG